MNQKPFAITLGVGSSLNNKTGSWRVERPVYVNRQSPCSHACPAHEDIQGWLYQAEEGNYEAAWRILMRANPLPAVMGRACFHPCESACNRVAVDDAVGINAIERFLGDTAIERGWEVVVSAPPTGQRVLVVGSGPAGLSAAYHLRLQGHEVEVHEAAARAGGMLRYGIPKYRLPRSVVDAEISRIERMGVVIVLESRVEQLSSFMATRGFDAAFIAVGAQRGRNPEIPSGDAAKVLDAVTMLHEFEDGEGPVLGRRVVVYGGGDTAMDAARTAQRLGATETIVIYRRTRERMPAHDEEVFDSQAEGVQMRWLSTVTRAEGRRVMLETMVLNERGLAEGTGEFEEIEADSLVLALGQDTDLTLISDMTDIDTGGHVIGVDEGQRTGHTGVFAGGDVAFTSTGERTVTAAIGHGAVAAASIGAHLQGRTSIEAPERTLATADRLNLWYYSDAPRTMRPRLEAVRRRSNFDEIVGGLTAEDALFEARRCLSCGNCFECDNCFGVCPDNAVVKLGSGLRYEINLDYCKGCGICAQECPCGAIDMVAERR